MTSPGDELPESVAESLRIVRTPGHPEQGIALRQLYGCGEYREVQDALFEYLAEPHDAADVVTAINVIHDAWASCAFLDPSFLQLLQHPSSIARSNALRCLRQLNHSTLPLLATVITLLGDPGVAVQREAAMLLNATTPEVFEQCYLDTQTIPEHIPLDFLIRYTLGLRYADALLETRIASVLIANHTVAPCRILVNALLTRSIYQRSELLRSSFSLYQWESEDTPIQIPRCSGATDAL